MGSTSMFLLPQGLFMYLLLIILSRVKPVNSSHAILHLKDPLKQELLYLTASSV
jgi:hypothetical protein